MTTEKTFQTKPPFSKPSQFRANAWMETEQGDFNEAKKLQDVPSPDPELGEIEIIPAGPEYPNGAWHCTTPTPP